MAINSRPGILIAAAALIVGGWLIYRGISGNSIRGHAPKQLWFYDIGSGGLYAVPFSALAPMDTESGPGRGVKAYVFTCGSCDDAKPLYLEKYTPEARQQMARLDLDEVSEAEKMTITEVAARSTLVAAPPTPGQEPAWVPSSSGAGIEIVSSYWKMCSGNPGKVCQPK